MADNSQPPTVEAEFFLTERDFVALTEYGQERKRRRETIFFWAMTLVLCALALWQLWPAFGSGAYPGHGWIVLVVIALAGLWVHYFMPPIGIRRLMRKTRIGDEPVRLVADGERLVVSNAGVETRVDWKDLGKRGRTEEHFFFWFNALQAFIVPLKDLDEARRERLWALSAPVDENEPS